MMLYGGKLTRHTEQTDRLTQTRLKKNADTVDFSVHLPDVPGRVLLFRDTTQQTTRLGAWSDAARVSVRHPRDRSICAPLYQL